MNDTNPVEKITLRHRLEYAGLSGIVTLTGWLPYKSLRPLANFLGAIGYFFDARGRRVARANLDSAFGDEFSRERKDQIARGSYQTFARTVLELFWSPNLTEEKVREIVRCEGLDDDPCHKNTKQAGIYYCQHFSNFEWLAQSGSYAVSRGPVIAQRFKNPLIGPIFNRLRASSGNDVIPQERAMIRMLKYLKGGGKFGILIDLNLDPREGPAVVNCFGGLKTCVTQTHAALAVHTGAKLVPVQCFPEPDGGYRIVYHKPVEFSPDSTLQQIAQKCWDVLEPGIRKYPEGWLWSYKHWRFKPEAENERYPYYANTAKRFEKLLKNS